MRWQELFNTSIVPKSTRVRGEPRIVTAEETTANGVFITPQSLMTFPVATAAISFIWKTIDTLLPNLNNSLWIPAIASLVFGAFTFYVGISDPKANLTSRDIVIGAFVAIINSFYLFASSVGIVSTIGNS